MHSTLPSASVLELVTSVALGAGCFPVRAHNLAELSILAQAQKVKELKHLAVLCDALGVHVTYSATSQTTACSVDHSRGMPGGHSATCFVPGRLHILVQEVYSESSRAPLLRSLGERGQYTHAGGGMPDCTC